MQVLCAIREHIMNIEYTGNLLLRAMHYLPFGGQYLIPYEFEADPMQVPRGAGGPLERCFDGDGNFKKGNPNA